LYFVTRIKRSDAKQGWFRFWHSGVPGWMQGICLGRWMRDTSPKSLAARKCTMIFSQRSERMGLVKSQNTGPERMVRSVLANLGFRFRLHVEELPGCPDVVIETDRCVILVHGCFWHRHACRNGRRTPKTRVGFWRTKFADNKARDSRNRSRLRRLRWRALVIWECQIRDRAALSRRIRRFLDGARVGS
jgi:DNA mismatch endonuclease (patch repair protein)